MSEPVRSRAGQALDIASRGATGRGLALAFVALLCASSGCRHGAEPRSTSTASDTYRAGQPAMRSGERRPSPAAQQPLGTLTPVEPNTTPPRSRATAPAAPQRAEKPELPPLITVTDDARRRDVTLRDGALSVPGGLMLNRIPKGVVVHTVEEQRSGDTVWEFVDARGRRLALLKAERAGLAALRDDALRRTDDARARRSARWGKSDVQVVTERFRGETHVYTLDRRAAGTDWIWSGLELAR